jgi:hypothetical protein
MTTPKGYSSQEKEDRLSAEFVTVSPAGENQHGLDVIAHSWVASLGSDAVEAASTTSIINATAHAALKGDLVSFTSGTFSGREFPISAVDTNTITLGVTLSAAPGTGDTFDIKRYTNPEVSALGAVVSFLGFIRDGGNQIVTEDTATPANNRPLPVKLTDFSGDMVLNAANLNLEVQLGSTGANPDSVQIGDGTEILSITAANEAEVRTAQLPAALGQLAKAASTSVTLASDQDALPITDNGGSLTVDSAQLPATLGQKAKAASLAVTLASDEYTLAVSQGGRSSVDLIRNDYTGTNVTTATYVELIAGTSGIINQLHIFDSSGETLVLATGSGPEVDVAHIPPGGLSTTLDLNIPAGTRLSVKAVSATASVGELTITALS